MKLNNYKTTILCKKKIIIKRIYFFIFTAILFSSCSNKKESVKSIAIFAPGIIADSPIYAMMADGVKKAVEQYNFLNNEKEAVKLDIIEAGTNQAEWSSKLTAVTAEGGYSLIITSNPSMPDLAEPISVQFPNQKYIILDAYKEGNPNVATVRYNQKEQSYLAGYAAALMSKTQKIGLIAGQEYPVMNNIILPGFIEGAKKVNNDIIVDFRIVGNWFSSSKGEELADAMAKNGVDVILPICGGASQGVISSAIAKGTYLTWFDINGFSKAPKNVIASSIMKQDEMAAFMTKQYFENKIEWGTAKTVGIKYGFVDFIQDDPIYIKNIPENIRMQIADTIENIRKGNLILE